MDEPTPIVYPKITVPGHGTYEVQFGFSAACIADREMQMDGEQVLKYFSNCVPRMVDGQRVGGHIRYDFLMKLLSACIWKRAHLTADQISAAFDDQPLAETTNLLVETLSEALLKTKWSAQYRLRETATPEQQEPTPIN